jgi:hypothetical protein
VTFGLSFGWYWEGSRRRDPGARNVVAQYGMPRIGLGSKPCVVCGSKRDVEAAHTGCDGGMSQKAGDYSCVPLCWTCHTGGRSAYHRIGRRAFERINGITFEELVSELNRLWQRHKSCS